MAKRLLQRLLCAIALAVAPMNFASRAQAAPATGVHTIQDLFEVCADKAAASQAACDAFVHATIQTAELMQAAGNGGRLTPLFCPGDQMGAQDLIALLRVQVAAHPERKDFPAPTAIIGGGIEAYPCSHQAGAAAPAASTHPATHRRARRR